MTAAILAILYVLGALAILLVVHFEQRRLDPRRSIVLRKVAGERSAAHRTVANRQSAPTQAGEDREWKHRSAAQPLQRGRAR